MPKKDINIIEDIGKGLKVGEKWSGDFVEDQKDQKDDDKEGNNSEENDD